MMNISSRVQRFTATAALSAALVTGSFASPAHALNANFGDLVLAIFGNDTEYFQVLGDANSLTTTQNPTMFDVSGALGNIGGNNAPRWTVFSLDANAIMKTGSSKAWDQFDAAEQAASFPITGLGVVNNWFGAAGTLPGTTSTTVPSTDPNSFTSRFATNGSFAGSYPVKQEGAFGQLLTILSADPTNTGNIMNMGQALLSANGLLTINPPVPLPAAVWLFGTGLISLAGLARRSSMMKS